MDEKKQPYRDRLRQELNRWDYTIQQWSAKTGIAKGTLDNMLLPNRRSVVSAAYLHAFWRAEPSIDLHYIVTGERAAPPGISCPVGQVDGPHNPPAARLDS